MFDTSKIHSTQNFVTIEILSPEGEQRGTMEVTCDVLYYVCRAMMQPQNCCCNLEVASSNTSIGVGLHIHPRHQYLGDVASPFIKEEQHKDIISTNLQNKNILLEANPIIAGAFFKPSFDWYGDERFLKEVPIWHHPVL